MGAQSTAAAGNGPPPDRCSLLKNLPVCKDKADWKSLDSIAWGQQKSYTKLA